MRATPSRVLRVRRIQDVSRRIPRRVTFEALERRNLLNADPVLNEFVFNHVGLDTNEFVEVFGDPSTDYSTLTVLAIEGDGSVAGTIDSVFPVGTTDADGYWTTGFLGNAFENGTATLLLVEGFSGSVGTDLDTDNDGSLDAAPWTGIVDAVGVSDGGGSDRVYSSVVLAGGFDGDSFTPGGASRIPNGTDTDSVSDWVRNDFDGAGLPSFVGGLGGGEALNTPGDVNLAVSNPVLNEFVANHTGTDNMEFVEVFGDPSIDYSLFSVLQIEGDSGASAGVIDSVFPVGITDPGGFWTTSFRTNDLENGTMTLLLVQGFSSSSGTDLDTDNDGVLDVTPWARIVDAVGVTDGDSGDLNYTSVKLGPGFDGNSLTPGGASRIPNGSDTDSISDWTRNDFDGEGLLTGVAGTTDANEALNTPGSTNTRVPDCSLAQASIELIWPPNHQFVPIDILGVTDPDGDALAITIDSIFQDESVDGSGSGDTSPDGQGVGTTTAQVRAERSGGGNGRVYHIGFTASDGHGGICSGVVHVGIPHNKTSSPVDDGPLFDSTASVSPLVFTGPSSSTAIASSNAKPGVDVASRDNQIEIEDDLRDKTPPPNAGAERLSQRNAAHDRVFAIHNGPKEDDDFWADEIELGPQD